MFVIIMIDLENSHVIQRFPVDCSCIGQEISGWFPVLEPGRADRHCSTIIPCPAACSWIPRWLASCSENRVNWISDTIMDGLVYLRKNWNYSSKSAEDCVLNHNRWISLFVLIHRLIVVYLGNWSLVIRNVFVLMYCLCFDYFTIEIYHLFYVYYFLFIYNIGL